MRPVNPVFTQLFELFLLFLLLTKNAHHKMTNCQPNWNFWLNATMPEWEWKEWAKLTEYGQKVFDVFKRSNWGNPAPAEWTGIIPFWCEICLPLIHPYCQFWKIFYIEKFPSFSLVDTSLGKTSKTGMFIHILQRLATNLKIFILKVLKCHQVR